MTKLFYPDSIRPASLGMRPERARHRVAKWSGSGPPGDPRVQGLAGRVMLLLRAPPRGVPLVVSSWKPKGRVT